MEPNLFSAQTIFAAHFIFPGIFCSRPSSRPISAQASPLEGPSPFSWCHPSLRVSSRVEAPPGCLPFPLSNSAPRRLPSPFYSMKPMASLNLHRHRWPDASCPLGSPCWPIKGASSTTTPHCTSCYLFLHLSVLQSCPSPIATTAACSSSPPASPRHRANRFWPRWGLLHSPLPFPFVAASSCQPKWPNDMTPVSPRPAMVARPWWASMPLRSMAHGLSSQFFLLKNKLKIQLISEILAYSPLSFIEIKV
jgi:hypothetical protein